MRASSSGVSAVLAGARGMSASTRSSAATEPAAFSNPAPTARVVKPPNECPVTAIDSASIRFGQPFVSGLPGMVSSSMTVTMSAGRS